MARTNSKGTISRALLEEQIRAIRLVAFDFDGVFTDNMVYVSQDGTESVKCFRGDGLGLNKLERAGIAAVILSTETNPVVTARSQKLGIRCIQGCEDKGTALQTLAREMGISLEQVAFVGNDLNDLACLEAVGLPIVVRDAHPDVIPGASYRTSTPGGHGAVREICDLFERVIATERG
ncbi:MAG: 3-deoxy-D-manno-octulosonate 8-phosphate phosphatase [Chloroflexi bacterium RBG_16_58_8]|nr:MAG: 3-deoxy-D-manno-octulosonate 8-phosphate phosphatase [Chloroflexi bacterium RBG_16_58_8]